MHASFHHFDTDRSGTLEKHEVQQALEHSGAPLLQIRFSEHVRWCLLCSWRFRRGLPPAQQLQLPAHATQHREREGSAWAAAV
ncbi:MAG: hypothetical protein HC767_14055 [Akkermansiaceae bacterium]|nr:hypothetical protein [Akkermansiaceae bacterium]